MSTIKSSAENLTLNADGANNDVIIQSNGSTKVTVDGQNSRVGIGTTSPARILHVSDTTSGATTGIRLTGANNGSQVIEFADTDDTNVGYIQYDHGNNRISIRAGDANRLNIDSDGLKFNSDTAAANALDDYEEGTWTPTITFGGNSASVAYSTQTGHYTKIGRAVTLYGHVALSNKGSSTGHLNIAGLPFTPAGDYAPVSLRFQNLSFADMATAIVSSGATTVIFYETANGGAETSLTNSNAANNTRILFQTTYRV